MSSNDDGPRVALLAGASGLVGRELVAFSCGSDRYVAVHSLVRRPSGLKHEKLQEHVVDFESLPALPAADDVLIALGTTIAVAGSEEAFRRVDHDYVVAVARAARAAGATRLGLVSALGADVGSRVFYNRVKGETERDVASLGYESVVIVQPSLLLGDRESLGQPTRRGEALARRLLGPIAALLPASFRPISARGVAASLLRTLAAAEPGVRKLPSRELEP